MQRKSLLTLFFLSGFSALVSLRAFYLLGHLPLPVRPGAHNSLMLSFGNGITTGALATHQIPVVEVVELAAEMVERRRCRTTMPSSSPSTPRRSI